MSELRPPGATRRILLAEDEPGLQEAMALALEMEGFEVIRAYDGKDALARLPKVQVHLIISDFMMPRMNGIEMIEALRQDSAYDQVPILLLSAALPHYVNSGVADAFLQKPIVVNQLLETVAHLLNLE